MTIQGDLPMLMGEISPSPTPGWRATDILMTTEKERMSLPPIHYLMQNGQA